VWIETQRLNEILTVKYAELDAIQSQFDSGTYRNLKRSVKVAPII
jgi:hypothetical protein